MPLARTGESDEPSTRRHGGRLLLVAGLILVLGAAGVLVLSDDLRFLRLGIVAGLWAALVGAFIAARYRGQVADREDRAADLQAVYELELEREIAARREYELQVEAEIRAEVDEQSRRDVAALRDELRTLRQTLENLLGGEVLVERYALQAQATRMRPLQEAQVKRLPAAVNGPQPEPVTEQFDSVTELRPVKNRPRAVAPLPRRADRPERPPWPIPTAAKPSPVDTPDPRVAELPPTVVAQFRPPAAEQPPPRMDTPPPPLAERSRPRMDRPPPEQSLPRMNPVPPPQAERSQSRMNPVPPARAERSPSRLDRPQPPEQSLPRMNPVPPPQVERSRSRMDRPQPEQSLPRMNPVQPPPDWSQSRMDRPQQPEQSQLRMNPVPPARTERSPLRMDRAQPPERSLSRMNPVQPPPERSRMDRPPEQSLSRMNPVQPGPRTPEPWEVGPDGRAQQEPRTRQPAPEQSLSGMSPPPGPRAGADSMSRMNPAPPEFRPAPPTDSLSRLSPAQPEPWEVEQPGRRSVERQRAAEPEPVRTAWDERPVAPPPHPAEVSDRWFVPGALRQEPSGRHSGTTEGRRRRAEEPEPPPRRHARPDEEPGGRRRRAEETPSWQELATWDPVVKATSRGWAPDDSGGHARADEGSHASGHSVADLLAQHGAENPRRRRRRED